MTPQLSPAWQRFFAQPATPAAGAERLPGSPPPLAGGPSWGSTPTRRQAARDGGATSVGAAPPPRRPTPVETRPTPPEPPRREKEFAWLTWQMPARLREDVIVNLRQILRWRAQHCRPLDPPAQPVEYTRFGLLGEQLCPKGAHTVCSILYKELRETVRMVEAEQPLLERNRRLAMHSARLGQLCAELERRGIDALEEMRGGLAWLWD